MTDTNTRAQQDELNILMCEKSYEEAKRELRQAKAVVERLQRETAVAEKAQKEQQQREKEQGKKLTHIIDGIGGDTEKGKVKDGDKKKKAKGKKTKGPLHSSADAPEYGSKTYWNEEYKKVSDGTKS